MLVIHRADQTLRNTVQFSFTTSSRAGSVRRERNRRKRGEVGEEEGEEEEEEQEKPTISLSKIPQQTADICLAFV